jgi:hypothetical protein
MATITRNDERDDKENLHYNAHHHVFVYNRSIFWITTALYLNYTLLFHVIKKIVANELLMQDFLYILGYLLCR